MRRRTTLGFLGVLLAGGAGYLSFSDSPGSIGPGRYREGRGRLGREGARQNVETSTPFVWADSPGAECACANASGSFGSVIAVTRASDAMCTKGNWLSGIEVGEMVMCGSDELRVMSGDDSGDAGYLSEEATTNTIPLADQQDFTGWTVVGTGIAGPTVSPPDAGLCPDGTNTATRITVPATTGVQRSFIYKGVCPNTGAKISASAYVRGYSASGTAAMTLVAADWTPVRKAYAAATWTRFMYEDFTPSYPDLAFGNDSLVMGAQDASDFLICFPQCEQKNHATSYTTGTRAADFIATTFVPPLFTDLTLSATVLNQLKVPVSGGSRIALLSDGYSTFFGPSLNAALICENTSSTISEPQPAAGVGAFTPNGSSALSCAYSGRPAMQLTACIGSSCADGGVSDTNVLGNIGGPQRDLLIGGYSNIVAAKIYQPDAIVKNIRVTSPSRKTVYFFGDSIIGGSIPHAVFEDEVDARSGATVSLNNQGQSGEDIDQCETRWNATVTAIRAHPGTAARSTMMIQCGTNNSSGPDAGYVSDRLKAMLWDAKDAGITPLWSTIMPRSDHCDFIHTVNATMAAWCSANGVAQADTYTPMWNGAGCDINPALATDSLHPNEAGAAVMFGVWAAKGLW